MPGALAVRLSLAFAVVALLLALLIALTLEALHNEAARDLRKGRFAYSLAQMKQQVETPLSLGLGIEGLTQVQRLLRNEAEVDPSILSIDLFNAQGRLLFTTDAAGIRDAVPGSWLDAMRAQSAPEADRATHAEVWQVEERNGEALGLTLFNDFGLAVGGLVLRHDAGVGGEAVISAENQGLSLSLLALAALATGGAGLGFWLLCRRPEREAGALALEFAGGEAVERRDATTGLSRTGGRLLQALRRAERRCDSAAAEVERIDARH